MASLPNASNGEGNICLSDLQEEERNAIVRRHFEGKGYRVHSGLQFGCELVLYADTPERVHSDFCVHVVPPDGHIDWRRMQTLTRSMPDLHKTLILAYIRLDPSKNKFQVDELAIATEHAPFRHKNAIARRVQVVGNQRKKAKVNTDLTVLHLPGTRVHLMSKDFSLLYRP